MLQKKIIINNLNINYYQSDSFDANKDALIFLPGWNSQAILFKNTLEQCDNFIAIDLPGFGKSDCPATVWSLSDYAQFLKTFLEKLNLKNIILAGHSFGGSVIIKYCAGNHLAKKIILIDSAGIRTKSIKKTAYKIIAKILKIILALPGLSLFQNKIKKGLYRFIGADDYVDAGCLKKIYLKIINEDLQDDMRKINTETILIWGKNDKDTSISDGLLINKLIEGSKIFIINNAAHYVFLDQPQEFNKIFFEQIKC